MPEPGTRDLRHAREMRREVMDELRAYGSPLSDYAAAELIVGELISNAFKHAGGVVQAEIAWGRGVATFHVTDAGGPFQPRRGRPELPHSRGGWGLFLVSKLATEFEVDHIPATGNHVRAVLPVHRN